MGGGNVLGLIKNTTKKKKKAPGHVAADRGGLTARAASLLPALTAVTLGGAPSPRRRTPLAVAVLLPLVGLGGPAPHVAPHGESALGLPASCDASPGAGGEGGQPGHGRVGGPSRPLAAPPGRCRTQEGLVGAHGGQRPGSPLGRI